MSVTDLGASTDLSSVIKAYFNVQKKGTSNSGNKETYWTIFTLTFYSSVIQVLQHVQCLSSQYPRNMNNLTYCLFSHFLCRERVGLCEVSSFKRAKESRFYYVLNLFGFNMCIFVLVKNQVNPPHHTYTHTPQPKQAFWTIKS